MKRFLQQYGKWFCAIFFFLLFILITYYVKTDQTKYMDDGIYQFIHQYHSEGLDQFFIMITGLASPLVIVVITFIILIFFKPRYMSFWAFVNLIIVSATNTILKLIFMRDRPLDFSLIKETGYSYPSGHSMVSLCFYGFLIYLIWKSIGKKRYKTLLTVALSVMIIFVGLSRIYLRVHFASDVVAGFSISIVYLIIFISVVQKWSEKYESIQKNV